MAVAAQPGGFCWKRPACGVTARLPAASRTPAAGQHGVTPRLLPLVPVLARVEGVLQFFSVCQVPRGANM